jgi:hypothetical protein
MATFNFKDPKDFDAVKAKAEALYSTIGSVRTPYFKETVAFNAKGIRHLKFKSDEVARPSKDQYPRLKLLRLAPEVLKLSHTVQGIWQTKQFEREKTNGRWERTLRDVTFYEFLAVIDKVRVKVIVKEVGGEKYFWSIIPFWRVDTNKKRLLYSGRPDSD